MHVLPRAPQPLTLLVFRRSDGAAAAAADSPGGGGGKGGGGGGTGGGGGGKGGGVGGSAGWSVHARSEWARLGGETMGDAAGLNTSRAAHEARLQLLTAELPPGEYVLRLAFYQADAPGGRPEPMPLLGTIDAPSPPSPHGVGAALGSGLLRSLWSAVYHAFGGGSAPEQPEQPEVEVNAELSVAPLAQLTREQQAEEEAAARRPADQPAAPPLLNACDPRRADAPLPAAARRRGSHTFVQRGLGLTISSATLQRGGPPSP